MWYEIYGANEGGGKYSSLREWRVLSMASPSMELDPAESYFPFSIKPDRKLGVQDVIGVYRDTYGGTQFDITERPEFRVDGEKSPAASPYGMRNTEDPLWNLLRIESERTISQSRTGFCWVNQLRGWLPDPIGGVMWYANDCPGTSVFVPIHVGAVSVPDAWAECDATAFDGDSAWWNFNIVNNLAFQSLYQMAIEDIRVVQRDVEHLFFSHQGAIENTALGLYKGGEEDTRDFLTAYTHKSCDEALNVYSQLLKLLLYKYYAF